MFLISLMFVCLGIAIASTMEDMHGFQLIVNFILMPLFFLSGALFPLSTAPDFLKTVSLFDPLTYGVNGLRFLLLGHSDIGLLQCFGALLAFTAAFALIAVKLFERIED